MDTLSQTNPEVKHPTLTQRNPELVAAYPDFMDRAYEMELAASVRQTYHILGARFARYPEIEDGEEHLYNMKQLLLDLAVLYSNVYPNEESPYGKMCAECGDEFCDDGEDLCRQCAKENRAT